jgi:hypothetical protein
MPRFLTDANFNHRILRGLLRRRPDIDVLIAQDLGFQRTADPDVLEWAAQYQCVLLTHDVNTMPAFAIQRIREGKYVAGVVAVAEQASIRRAIDDILLLLAGLGEDEWENQIHWVPL